MIISRSLVTAEQLFKQPADGYRYELLCGELRMMSPAGGRHGRIANRIAFLLGKHVEPKKLGVSSPVVWERLNRQWQKAVSLPPELRWTNGEVGAAAMEHAISLVHQKRIQAQMEPHWR